MITFMLCEFDFRFFSLMQVWVSVASGGTCMGLGQGASRAAVEQRTHRDHLSWRPLTHRTVRVLGPRDSGTSVLKASSAAAGKRPDDWTSGILSSRL